MCDIKARESARHDHVGEEEVERALVLLPDFEGFVPLGGFGRAVPEAAQHAHAEQADRVVVLDDEDRFLSTGGLGLDGGGWGESLVGRGECNPEGGAVPHGAFEFDPTFVLFDDAKDGREAQLCAFSLLFGGIKGFEQFVDLRIADSRAIITEVDSNL